MANSIIPFSEETNTNSELAQPFNKFLPASNNYIESFNPEVSSSTLKVLQNVDALKISPSDSGGIYNTSLHSKAPNRSIEEVLFDACAEVKILTSKISMYLNSDFRNNLFEQIDLIHDSDDWEADEEPVNLLSFKSFLRWYFLAKPNENPGIGLNSNGNLIAAWANDRDRLIIEFLKNDHAKWIVTRYENEELERGSGQTTIARLELVLSPYNLESFFNS